MPDYFSILRTFYSDSEWNLSDNDYETLQWLSNSTKPTQSELDALWESTKATVAEQKAQAEATKASALAKLAALGLTQDEVKALVG